MDKGTRNILAVRKVCMVLAILMGAMVMVKPALAEPISISGADHIIGGDASPEKVDVLTVTGQKGDTVYVNLKEGEEVLASHLAFTLDDENAEADENGSMVGVASVVFSATTYSPESVYNIEVYADHAEEKQLYAGTVSTVFASYGGKVVPLAIRTIAKGEDRPFSAPTTQEYESVVYKLEDETPQTIEGKQCYTYKQDGELAESIEAHVHYFDIENTADPIKTESITLAKNSSQDVPIESVIASDTDGSMYRTLQLTNKLTVSYPGTTEYNVMCKKLSAEWGAVGTFYTAYIRYVDAEGNSLNITDKVIVNKAYNYTAPNKLYINDSGTVEEYQIQDSAKAVISLAPGDSETDKTYDVVYEPVADDAERTWTVVLENGSVSPKDSNRQIDRITYKGRPGQSVEHTTKQSIEVDGQAYVPTNTAQKSYSHTFGAAEMGVEQVIYYVPDGYVAPEAYDITVKYVNIATNEVINTETHTASPSMRADLEIASPESFSQGGVEWIRLNGQDDPIRHGFYSPAREYVVYYRDANDDLHAQTVIRTVRTVYVDEDGNTVYRPTTVVDNGTTTTSGEEEGTTEEVVVTDETAPVETGVATGEDLLAIDNDATDDGDDGNALVTGDGSDLATTRIEDDETPLANLDSSKSASKVNNQALAIGGVGAAVAIGLIAFFFFKRRKKNVEESSNNNPTA